MFTQNNNKIDNVSIVRPTPETTVTTPSVITPLQFVIVIIWAKRQNIK